MAELQGLVTMVGHGGRRRLPAAVMNVIGTSLLDISDLTAPDLTGARIVGQDADPAF